MIKRLWADIEDLPRKHPEAWIFLAVACAAFSALCYRQELYFAALLNAFNGGWALGGYRVSKALDLMRQLRAAHDEHIKALMQMQGDEIGRLIAEHIMRKPHGEEEPRTLQ